MSKENFKTLLLSVLVVLSIVLTQQLWITIPIASITPVAKEASKKQIREEDNTINISEVLSPQSFIINFGGVYHTVIFSDSKEIWTETCQIMKGYFEEGVIIEEISPERWGQLNDVRGIKINLGYNMPMTVMKKVVEGKEFGLNQKVSGFGSLVIPVFEDGTAYLWDKEENKFYRVAGKVSKTNLEKMIVKIEEEDYDSYCAIKDLMGAENDQLLPIAIKNNIPSLKVGKEIDIDDLDQVDLLASAFFGENFDFVKRIVETNGSVVYMYGYGKKVLKVNATGALDYTEVMGEQQTESLDAFEAIKTSLEFIKDHGRLPADKLYLESITGIGKEKREGYMLILGYAFDGIPVHVDENVMQAPIEIKVMGNKVVSYKRWIKNKKIDVSFIDEEGNKEILPPKEVLDKNFEYIRRTYLDGQNQELNEGEEDRILKEILTSITTSEIGYYDQPVGEVNSLIPVWIIQIGQDVYYFDAHTGRIVNRFKK